MCDIEVQKHCLLRVLLSSACGCDSKRKTMCKLDKVIVHAESISGKYLFCFFFSLAFTVSVQPVLCY